MGELFQTLGIQWTKLIPQLFNFGIVLLVLWKFAYKPVFAMLDARQKKIAESVANADKIQAELARTEAARSSLSEQLSQRSIERGYLALVAGRVDADEGLIDAPIGRDDAIATRMAVRTAGRPARTRYRVEHRYAAPIAASLLACRLETGRTHQIRVHLAAIGHPVVGDERYGGPMLEVRRPFLHAAVLGFEHPGTGEQLHFEAELPADLAGLLARFGD